MLTSKTLACDGCAHLSPDLPHAAVIVVVDVQSDIVLL